MQTANVSIYPNPFHETNVFKRLVDCHESNYQSLIYLLLFFFVSCFLFQFLLLFTLWFRVNRFAFEQLYKYEVWLRVRTFLFWIFSFCLLCRIHIKMLQLQLLQQKLINVLNTILATQANSYMHTRSYTASILVSLLFCFKWICGWETL